MLGQYTLSLIFSKTSPPKISEHSRAARVGVWFCFLRSTISLIFISFYLKLLLAGDLVMLLGLLIESRVVTLLGRTWIHAWQAGRQILEKLPDVDSCLSTSFDEHDSEFFSQGLSFLSSNSSLLCHVYFISNQDDE